MFNADGLALSNDGATLYWQAVTAKTMYRIDASLLQQAGTNPDAAKGKAEKFATTEPVDGLDVTRTPSDVLARRLAILRQDNHIAARLTVRDLVSFGRYPHSKGRLTIEDRGRIDEAIAFLELEDLCSRFLDELSGGQRQRAFVAMVLCQETDYVLLDEPLNNLDLKHAARMMQQLRRAARDLGKTVVVVLHDINFASAYSDHIVCMQSGRVTHEGPPAEIITAEVLSSVYQLPVRVEVIDGRRIGIYYDQEPTP
ncbi:MAG: ATP-binding cassette domain-containing protein [Hyphomicrobiales bacterium]|nr:MAG: ATP-binding cassette domain-containing protein [Hyphomicrobiales bacterium]